MTDDIFAQRVAAVRRRFAARLDDRIGVIASAMPQPGCEDGLDILAIAHREAHGLCGIGHTLGFVGTGQVARSLERLLLAALTAERTLTDEERYICARVLRCCVQPRPSKWLWRAIDNLSPRRAGKHRRQQKRSWRRRNDS
jgi:chemotaxis protein histidine kinase CheA